MVHMNGYKGIMDIYTQTCASIDMPYICGKKYTNGRIIPNYSPPLYPRRNEPNPAIEGLGPSLNGVRLAQVSDGVIFGNPKIIKDGQEPPSTPVQGQFEDKKGIVVKDKKRTGRKREKVPLIFKIGS